MLSNVTIASPSAARMPRRQRMIVEVVVPTRNKRQISNVSDSDDEDFTPSRSSTKTSSNYNRSKRVRIALAHDEIPSSSDESDDSDSIASRPSQTRPRKSALRLSQASSRAGGNIAGPSGARRTPTPEQDGSEAGSSTSRGGMAALAAAIDFVQDPEGILAVSGNTLQVVVTSPSSSTGHGANVAAELEAKPDLDLEEEYAVDASKLGTPEPEVGQGQEEEDELECAVCYESMREMCKRAEDEQQGGISGHLAVYACDQQACGAICCIHCMIAMANNNLSMYKAITCPLCTRPANIPALRAQATAFNPASGGVDPIRRPRPPPPPLPPVATIELRDQYINDVIEFNRSVRPQQQYFVNAQPEYHQWVADRNPAAAMFGPAGTTWLAQSAWECFWFTKWGRDWRGLPFLRANTFLRRAIEALGIEMPPRHVGIPRRLGQAAGERIREIAQAAQNHGVLADPERAARFLREYRAEIQDLRREQDQDEERQVRAGAPDPEPVRPPINARRGRAAARAARERLEQARDDDDDIPEIARFAAGNARAQAAARGVVALAAAVAADQIPAPIPEVQARARAAVAALERPTPPPPEQVGLNNPGLGFAGNNARPGVVLTGLDILLAEAVPVGPRRAILQAMLGLRGPNEADVLVHNMRIAFGLERANGDVPPTPAEMARLRTLRTAWGHLNQGRQGILAAQGHQLPVAAFHAIRNQPGV